MKASWQGDLPVLSDPPVLLQDLFPSWLTLALSLLVLPNSLPSHSVDSWFPYLSLPTLSLVSHTRNNAESNTESLEVGSEWRKEEIVKKSSCNRMIDGSRTSTIGGDLSGLWCIQRVLGGIGEKGKELTVWGSRVEDRLRKRWSCSVYSSAFLILMTALMKSQVKEKENVVRRRQLEIVARGFLPSSPLIYAFDASQAIISVTICHLSPTNHLVDRNLSKNPLFNCIIGSRKRLSFLSFLHYTRPTRTRTITTYSTHTRTN